MFANVCGGSNVYCPTGTPQPVLVQPGYYSVGTANMTTRVGVKRCELGYWCDHGTMRPCKAGRYGAGRLETVTIHYCLSPFISIHHSVSVRFSFSYMHRLVSTWYFLC